MIRHARSVLVVVLAIGAGSFAKAQDAEVKAVLDKAIKALGGEEKLKKAENLTWKSEGTITFGDNENPFKMTSTANGIDNYRSEFTGEFGGNEIKAMAVLAGKKGWRKFNDMNMEMDEEGLANEKRMVYLQIIPVRILPLLDKGFKTAIAADEKVNDKPAAVVKATGPDGKDFKLYFDKESGLPVKLVATVKGFQGEDYEMGASYSDYKDFDGIKKATKQETTRDGEKFQSVKLVEFKVLDKADPKLFTEP